ncbi:MAG: hypothetical protein R3F59_06960 [Myxococcota bacterium]
MSDQLPDSGAITLRPPASMDRAQYLRSRLQRSDARLRHALLELNRAAHELTPAATVSRRPIRFVVGAFALGLVVGFLTRTHSNHHGG